MFPSQLPARVDRAVADLENYPRLQCEPAGPRALVTAAAVEQKSRLAGSAQRFERGLEALRRIELTHCVVLTQYLRIKPTTTPWTWTRSAATTIAAMVGCEGWSRTVAPSR